MVEKRPEHFYVGEATRRHYWPNSREVSSCGNAGQSRNDSGFLEEFTSFQSLIPLDTSSPQVQKFYKKYGFNWHDQNGKSSSNARQAI